MLFAGVFIPRHELLIARVPHIGTELAGIMIARIKRSKLLLELGDIIPDNLIHIGISQKSLLARILGAYFRVIYQMVDFIAVLGKNMPTVLKQRGVPPNRILLWPQGADSEHLDACDGWKIKQRYHINNKFVAVYAGSFNCYYHIPNMVRAASLLQERLPEFHLMLVGTGIEWQAVKKMIETNGLVNVTLVGPVEPKEVGSYLQAADVFIHSVGTEKIPEYLQNYLVTKICEYLMVGRPVVAVENDPVIGNYLEKIGAGFVVPVGKPEALADKITFFMTNQKEAVYCGNRARQYARTYLERETIVKKFYIELKLKLNGLDISEGN